MRTLSRGPLHGYAIAQSIRQVSRELLQVEEGSLYPALQRLLREGWAAAEWGVSAKNRRVRTYRITDAGQKQLACEVKGFEQVLQGIRLVLEGAE